MSTLRTQQTDSIDAVIETMAHEQLEFLTRRYNMTAQEIIHLYTGKKLTRATHKAALNVIIEHRMTAEPGSSNF